ncbi:MAG: hypothetical protein M1839_008583 [Geoglossum umbratile]|nr:MAG: hypothetical protein M1839_008583 [Geoglossum umbratile]
MDRPFDPATDLVFTKPDTVVRMLDIGLGKPKVSPIALAGPFPMFSEKAAKAMAHELMAEEVIEKCKYGNDTMSFQLRGACPGLATYSHEAWTHPETLRIISEILQVDVTPVMPFEIACVNVHLGGDERERNSIIYPHKDSYPFVCIVMLSGTFSMTGGMLDLVTGTGEIMKTSKMSRVGPHKNLSGSRVQHIVLQGSAIILQGRYIDHYVPYCADKRITVVTSFRPSSPFLPDDTRLTTVRSISDIRLYREFFEYREGIAIKRMERAIEILSERISEGFLNFLHELIAFYQQTREGLVGEGKVDSVPPQNPDSPVSRSKSLTNPHSGLAPKLKNMLRFMMEISNFQLGELYECNIQDLVDFIADQERQLKRIRKLFWTPAEGKMDAATDMAMDTDAEETM